MVNQTIQIFARLKPTRGKKGVSRQTSLCTLSVFWSWLLSCFASRLTVSRNLVWVSNAILVWVKKTDVVATP